MAYKELASLEADQTISLGGTNSKTGKPNPTQVEGYYLGSKEVESPKSKSGKAYLYYFKTAKGTTAVWGKTNMDRKMASANIGEMTLVIQNGTQKTTNGTMYLYSVQQDDSNTISVSVPKLNTNERIDDDYDSSTNDEEVSTTTYEEDEARQVNALSAAERKAKVQSLLSKNTRK